LAPSFRPIWKLPIEVSDLIHFSLNHLRQSTVQLGLLLPRTLKVCCMALLWPCLTCQSRTGVPKEKKKSPLTRVLNRVMLSILPMWSGYPVHEQPSLTFLPTRLWTTSYLIGAFYHGPYSPRANRLTQPHGPFAVGPAAYRCDGAFLFRPSALHFYQGPPSTALSLLDPEPMIPSPLMTRDHQVSQPTPSPCPFPNMMPDIPVFMNTPMHAQHLVSHINPMNVPPQVYTNPIISLPPLPFQIYTTHLTNLAYPNAPTTHKLSSPSSRSTTRHNPYQRKGQASATREKLQIEDIYSSPLSELSKIAGQKRMDVFELFTNPSKKLATSRTG